MAGALEGARLLPPAEEREGSETDLRAAVQSPASLSRGWRTALLCAASCASAAALWSAARPGAAGAAWLGRGQAVKEFDLQKAVASIMNRTVGEGVEGPGSQGAGEAAQRKGSFLVIGDWGWDADVHGNQASVGCQKAIASMMNRTMGELGDVKFVVNVGDSFYPGGVEDKNDPQWDVKWRNVYSPQLRSVPWYSVYGNHDYHKDAGCACGSSASTCAQVNADITDLNQFYMPSTNWFKEHPELGVEVVAMDLNHYQWGWDHNAPSSKRNFEDCMWTSCKDQCLRNGKARSEEGFDVFYKRMNQSTAKNMLVFSHYPTDYLWMQPSFIATLKDNSRHSTFYFGGHRHNVDQSSTLSIAPNVDWLVGGGGGWGCEGYANQQGIVVGEIAYDGTITTRSVLVPRNACCATLAPVGVRK